jgi:hypothetical protein
VDIADSFGADWGKERALTISVCSGRRRFVKRGRREKFNAEYAESAEDAEKREEIGRAVRARLDAIAAKG